MSGLNAVAVIAVIGAAGGVFYLLKGFVLPSIVVPIIGGIDDALGGIDDALGGIIGGIVVPAGENGIAVEYWKARGLEFAPMMAIARGEFEVPAIIRNFLPESFTVGDYYTFMFNFAQTTTVGDIESYFGCGISGKSHEYLSNLYQYADATNWRIDTLEQIYNAIQEEFLWDVVL